MLAAIPDSNLSLGLLEAVLTSLSNNQQPILSENLKTHFISVLHSAATLANNPETINSTTSSEAIELAFRMQGSARFLEAVSKLENFGSIKSEDAKFLLDSLKKMLLKSNLRLLLNQLDNLSETPYFSADLDLYIRELSEVLNKLLEKLDHSPIAIDENVAHTIANSVWGLTQFLTGSTTKRIPYEVCYAIQKASSEWGANKLLITTSIIQEANFYFHSSSRNLFDLIEKELGVKISHQPVQIALPEIYRHKPLFCVPLFHELGHFIDINNDVVTTSMLKYSHLTGPDMPDLPKAADIAKLPSFQQDSYKEIVKSHRAEYFADLISATYTGDAAIGFLKEFIPTNQPANVSHPSSIARYNLIDDFLNNRKNAIIDLFQEVLNIRGLPQLHLRYTLPALESAFQEVRPVTLKSDSDVFGVFAAGWRFLMDAFQNPIEHWVHLSENDRERISNDLVEKSIRNRMILEGWNEATNP